MSSLEMPGSSLKERISQLNARRLARQPHREFRETRLLTVAETEEFESDPVKAAKTQSSKPRLIGYSRSADRTFFVIPELRIGLDAGEVRGSTLEHVFVTHGHSDHSLDVHWFAVCREEGTDVYVPKAAEAVTRQFITSTMELNLCERVTEEHLRGLRLHGVSAGERFEGIGRAGDWSAVVFDCCHTVPCVGYAFSQDRKKRRPEYRGLPAQRMKELRAQGVDFEHLVREPRFVYVGDTSIEVFAMNPWLFEYPVIIVECTFLERVKDGVDLSARVGHIFWEGSLQSVVESHPEVMFVLIHFSLRYSVEEVEEFFVKQRHLKNFRLHLGSMSDLGQKSFA